MNTKITDLSFLQEVTDNNPNTLKELIDILIEQSDESICLISKYLEENNWFLLGALAHKTKASVRTIGMPELGNQLEQVEYLSKGNARLLLQQKKDAGTPLTPEEEKQWENLQNEYRTDINLQQLKPLIKQILIDYTLAIKELKGISKNLPAL